jgi:peptidyl-prolyl cis-trans isomerase D
MLQAIRDKVTGWIAYAIIFLISVPFALWGVNSYLGGGEAMPAATVNGEDISSRALDTAYASRRRQLAELFGGTIPAGFGDENFLKERVLTQLIEEYALRQYADKKRYRIGDEELNKLIRSMNVFQSDGQFDSSIYRAQLESQGYSPAGFEQEFRRTQSIDQLQTAINATAFILPEQQKQFFSLSNQTRKIRVLTRTVDSDAYAISEQEVEDYYQANAGRYMTPEQVKIDFLEVSLESIKSLVDVPEEQLLDRYQLAKESYTSAEYRTASHILLTVEDGISKDGNDQVRDRLADIRAQIVTGGDFASLARQFSEDPGSAADGGNLGEIEKGMMVQPFEKALFSMQVGELSEPIKTTFGWHLIKLDQVSGGETRSYDEVRVDIEDEIRSDLAESQIYDLVENLANLAYEQSDSLSPAAEQLGLELQTSQWFDRQAVTGIALEPQIRNVAFSNDVLNQGINSEAIELADGRVVFLRINDRKPPAQQALDEVSDAIIETLKRDKGRQHNKLVGEQAFDALKSGKSLDDIAADWNIDLVDQGFIGRDDPALDHNLLRLAFRMKKPADGLVFDLLAHANGDYSLVELSAVISNDSDVDSERAKALNSAAAGADYQAVLKVLASRAEVVRTPLSELQ